jgi:hypothetical protein
MINSSNRMLGLALNKQLCPLMEHRISPIHQIGPTNHLEQDISCAILQAQASVLAVLLQRLCQESVRPASLMGWMATARHSQHLHRARGRLPKESPQGRHCRLASTDSLTAMLLILGRGSSQASATSRTYPARVQLMPRCQRRSLSRKPTVRLTMKVL